MRFLVDAQLPPALARRIIALGHQGEHVVDCGMTAAADDVIWRYAANVGAVIVTKDEDFAVRRTMLELGPSVVWVRIGNTRHPEMLRRFEDAFPAVLTALEQGETLIELT